MPDNSETRRHFVKKLFAGTAGLLLGAETLAKTWKGPGLHPLVDAAGVPDWAEIRKHFRFNGKIAWLNTGTVGLMPDRVLEAVNGSMDRLAIGYYVAADTVYGKVATLIGADSRDIAITHNTTHGINIVAQGLPLKRGDEIILTDQEHAGNALPWLARAQRDKLVVKVLSPGRDKMSTMMLLSRLVTKRTKVIALPHITCTTGQVLPMKAIVDAFGDKVPYILFDGAHGPGTTPVDVKEIGCGFYASCGHKWLCGPAGSGFLYIQPKMLDVLKPMFVGAGSDKSWDLNVIRQGINGWQDSAARFEYGTTNRALREGMEAAIDFHMEIGTKAIQERTIGLSQRLRKQIEGLEWLEILTPSEAGSYGPILTFRPREITKQLSLIRYLQNGGEFRIREVRESGLDAIRVSTHFFNTEDEVDRLAETLIDWAK